jgi:hypothetical protein
MIRASKQCSLFFVLSIFFSCSRQIAISPNDYYHNDGATTFSAHSDDSSVSVLYFTESCFIFARSSKPYAAVISPDFDPKETPANILDTMYSVKILYIESSSHPDQTRTLRFEMQQWLRNFRNLQVIKFENVEFGKMDTVERLKIKHLIIGNVRPNHSLSVGKLVDLNFLKYLVYTNAESIEDLSSMPLDAPHLIILKEKQYNKLVDRRKIIVID